MYQLATTHCFASGRTERALVLHDHFAMKTREEQLEAWVAKRAKPLASISNSIVANRPPKPSGKRPAVHEKNTSAGQRQSAGHDNKENQCTPVAATARTAVKKKPAIKAVKEDQSQAFTQSSKADTDKSVDVRTSLQRPAKKAALSATCLQNMENQYDMLKGSLDTLKRESMRSVRQACNL